MLSGIFDNLQFWHWFVFAIILVVLEIFSPAAFFIWMGAAAGVTGAALLALPGIGWETQFIIFSIASIAAILLGRSFFNRKEINTEDPTVTQLESSFIGKVYEVEQAIHNGNGRVKVGESTWKASGPDCDIGVSVRVIKVKGTELVVELA